MGRISAISVLAGALCGVAAFAILLTLSAAIAVGVHGGTDFSTTGDGRLKAVAGAFLVVSAVVSFVLAGYVAGRMARRRGGSSGLLAGLIGVLLAGAVGLALKLSGGDIGLARLVARDVHVTLAWPQWRYFSLVVGVSSAAAMMFGGLMGGIMGERWHSKLLARALDPFHGPEAAERDAARRMLEDAEMARLEATRRTAQVTATSHGRRTSVLPAPVPATPVPAAPVPATPVSAWAGSAGAGSATTGSAWAGSATTGSATTGSAVTGSAAVAAARSRVDVRRAEETAAIANVPAGDGRAINPVDYPVASRRPGTSGPAAPGKRRGRRSLLHR